MGKIHQFINSLGRATTTSNSDNYPNVNNTDRSLSYVDGKFDPDNEWTMLRASIQVHVPYHSQILTKLWIHIPHNFKPQTAKIQITDSAEPTLRARTIAAVISRRGQWLQIKSKQSIVVPDTKLRIDFDRIVGGASALAIACRQAQADAVPTALPNRNMLARLPEYFVYGKSIDGKSSFVGRGYFE